MNGITHAPPRSAGNGVTLFWIIIFFQYFSTAFQLLLWFKGRTDLAGIRDAFLYSLLWLIPIFLFPRHSRIVAAISGLILWLGSLVALGYYLIYHQQFSESVLFIIFESNGLEAKEFFAQYLTLQKGIILVVYSLIALLLWTRIKPITLSPTSRLVVPVILLIILLFPFGQRLMRGNHVAAAGSHLMARMVPASPWQLMFSYVLYRQQLANMDSILNENKKIPPVRNLTDSNGDTPRTLVLVIGESTTRTRMGIYGYKRDTTPRLQAIQQADANFSVFQHVVTSRPYTIEILQQALTFADQQHPDRWQTAPSLMQLMKQAGYKSFWITNQQTISERNTMLTVFSKQTDEQYYLNNERSQNAPRYDDNVFAPFEKVLADPAPKKFIVIHLLGTHIKYHYRFPESFARFRDSEGLPAGLNAAQVAESNDYDNAVLFNDYVVSSLIKRFADGKPNGFLLYLSDHGEEVYQTPPWNRQGRNETTPTRAMYTIPFMLWTSPRWAADHPRDFSAMLARKYSSSHLIHTWSDLAGLRYDLYQPELSLVNPGFVPQTRWIGDPRGKKLSRFDDLPSPQTGW